MFSRTSRSPLGGRVIESETQPGVTYHLETAVGEGGMGTAYLACRRSADGSSPVVVKVMRPEFGGGEVAPALVATKEAVALGRLNESVPPTPFVVRFIDAGSFRISGKQSTPWTAIEYVHGGIEGTTIEDRVTYSVHKTGYGFDATRAAHAIRCLAAGLASIHAAGVIHRDLTPGNVLCCGFGESEIFKISDFGVARASGFEQTFAGLNLGTLGYTAPESGTSSAGPQTDVFSFAGLLFYLLTGQHLFDARNPADAVRLFMSPNRPSIADHPTLSHELLDRTPACRGLDAAIARATSVKPADRPQTAPLFAATVLPWLGGEQASGPRSSRLLLSAVLTDMRSAPSRGQYTFTVRSRPRDDVIVRSTAWDTDGHAFAISPDSARFWNGSEWLDATRALAALPSGMTFTQRYEAGGWLVGGDSPTLAVIDTRGVGSTIDAPTADTCFWLASGRLDDLLTAVGRRPGLPPTLYALASRRWMKPIPLEGVAHVATLQRLDDARWVLGGRRLDGKGFAAVYSPMQGEVAMLPGPQLRSFIGGASSPERGVALLVGSDGVVLRVEGDVVAISGIPGEPDLAAAAVDILDREWATSLGTLWSRDQQSGQPWRAMWTDPSWTAPFVSAMADGGVVVAMTADGGIVEGRPPPDGG